MSIDVEILRREGRKLSHEELANLDSSSVAEALRDLVRAGQLHAYEYKGKVYYGLPEQS